MVLLLKLLFMFKLLIVVVKLFFKLFADKLLLFACFDFNVFTGFCNELELTWES